MKIKKETNHFYLFNQPKRSMKVAQTFGTTMNSFADYSTWQKTPTLNVLTNAAVSVNATP